MMLSQKPSNPQSLANMHMAWPKPGEKKVRKKWRTLLKNTQCFACNTASAQRQWTWLGPQNTAPCDLQVAVGWLLAPRSMANICMWHTVWPYG